MIRRMHSRQPEKQGRLGPALYNELNLKNHNMSTVKKMCLDPEQYLKVLTSLNKINVPWQHVDAAAAAKSALATAHEVNFQPPEAKTPDQKEN
jgi:hypothetical protein